MRRVSDAVLVEEKLNEQMNPVIDAVHKPAIIHFAHL